MYFNPFIIAYNLQYYGVLKCKKDHFQLQNLSFFKFDQDQNFDANVVQFFPRL